MPVAKNDCYLAWARPEDGVVKVYALHEASPDWMPAWQYEGSKRRKSGEEEGDQFYLERPEEEDCIRVDARLWARSVLRVYLVYGPPGVGKSEFTVWLASQLGLSIYRLSLTSSRLTDEWLLQLLSEQATKEENLLLQADEFQHAVRLGQTAAMIRAAE